ncbi:hypothetical protein AAH985_14110, partial [Enterococcus faecium]|uniref:hypothetical protein n=1 Tax=Enterococcus faecium TaxID=1352 RepID=UPI0031CD3041
MPRRICGRHAKIRAMSTVRKSAVPDVQPSAETEAIEASGVTPPATRPHIAERQEARRRQILDTAAQLFF